MDPLRCKFSGMVLGGAVGDALGVPHEFPYQKDVYTGVITHRGKLNWRYQGSRYASVGQVSDDTEMTLTLARSLLRNGRYNRDDVILSYMTWANTCYMLGKNTRALFKSIKTVRGFEHRWNLQHSCSQDVWSQSNGCLMRASPLVCVNDEDVIADCSITNPHPVTVNAVLFYVRLLRNMLGDVQDPIKQALQYVEDPQVKDCIEGTLNGYEACIVDRKGWVLHGIYCTVYCLSHFDSFQEAMDWVISQKGDTDTNAAITGCAMGIKLGFERMLQEDRTAYNIEAVLTADTSSGDFPRPAEYTLGDVEDIIDGLAELYSNPHA